jgi:PAS domain S-box-containing protein
MVVNSGTDFCVHSRLKLKSPNSPAKRKATWLLRSILFAGFLLLPIISAGEPAPKRILIVTSYELDRPANTIFIQGMRSTIGAGTVGSVEFFYEFQESTRISTDKYEDEMVSYMQRKYEGEKFDLIVALGAPALRILLRNESDLFPHTPKVFYFNDESEKTVQSFWPRTTGVWANLALPQTLDAALAVQPDIRRVLVISGNSSQDKLLREESQRELLPYEGKLEFTYLNDVTMDELKKSVASLPKDAIVLYLSFFLDSQGHNYSGPEAVSKFAPSSSVPIYGISETYLGSGIVGGSLINFEGLGKRTGQIGLRVLAGEKAQDIVPQTLPNTTVFDWRQLQRWNLDEKKLPAGSIVKSKTLTFWEQNKWYVMAIFAALMIEGLLIARLLFTQSRRARAEKESARLALLAATEHQRIGEIVSNVPGLVWETLTDPVTKERRTAFISDHVQTMLGYTVAEWLAEPPGFGFRIIADEEERERAQRESELAVSTGEETVSEFRWTAKDGRKVWVENHLTPIFDDHGKVIGLRGVTLDISGRKQAEERERQTQERSSAIVRAIPDLIFLQSPDGVYLDHHAKDPKDLLLPPEEFIGKNIRDVLPPPLAAQFSECFQRVSDDLTPQVLEYKLPLGEADRWFEARMVRSGDNVLSVVRDITNGKLAEASLHESEVNYRTIFNTANDAIFVYEVQTGAILDVNERTCEMYGYTVAEARSLTIADLCSNEPSYTTNEAMGLIQKAATGEPLFFEWRAKNKSGQFFWVEVGLRPILFDRKECLLAIVRDITDRKQAIDVLRLSEERFGKAFRANPQPMAIVSVPEGRYIDVNDSFLTMSGHTRTEVIGHTWIELNVWESPQVCADFLQRLLERGSLVNVERSFRTKDGSRRQLLSSAEQFDLNGEQCLLIASSDISERKEAEVALQRAHEEVSRLKNQLEEENVYLQEEIKSAQNFGEIVGNSDALKYVLFKIEQVGPTDSTVLITGETGTGKELVARAIHHASNRRHRPLVKVNCAALSPTLIESEFFGHEKGAFTGAGARKLGRFELANGASIFLDEIGELPPELQVKLLRVIQEGEIERLGSSKTIKVDVRIIAATNRNLELEVKKRLFREDLWYRLNVFPVTVPPLRQRREDIPLLVEHFVRRSAKKLGKVIESVSPATLKSLCDYSWPGNVRELANVIERAVINSQGPVLRIGQDFTEPEVEKLAQATKTLEENERDHITRILAETGWRIEGRQGAARILGINPSTLRSRISKLGIQKPGLALNSSIAVNEDFFLSNQNASDLINQDT